MDRGDRCEGLYAKVVGEAGSLTLASVVQFPRIADTVSEVLISWAAPRSDSVWLLAESADPRVPYRMSSLRVDDDSRFRWSLDIAHSEGLNLAKLPVLAWTNRSFAQQQQRVFLPLTVSAVGAGGGGDSTAIVVIPSVDASSLRLSVGLMRPDGNVTRWLVEDRSLGHTYYPHDQPVTAVLPRQAKGSVLRVVIAGQSLTGAPMAIALLVAGFADR